MATKKSKPSKQPAAKSNREKRHDEKERAKAAAAAARVQEQRRARLVNGSIIAVVVVLVLGLGYYIWSDANKPVNKPKGMSGSYGLVYGDADAAQEVVIYEDFLCGPCGQLEGAIGAQVDPAIATGVVNVEYRPINQLNTDYSKNAAQAFWAVLEVSGKDVAKKFHDALYADQPTESETAPDEEWLADKAEAAGSDRAKVLKALKDDTYEGLVEKSTEEGQSRMPKDARGGVATPTVLINGAPVTSTSLTEITNRVSELLTGVVAQTASTGAATASPSAPASSPVGPMAPATE